MPRSTLAHWQNLLLNLLARPRRRHQADALTLEQLEPRQMFATLDSLNVAAPIDEGGVATVVGEFSDADIDNQHRALIHWGDGSWDLVDITPGERTFTAQHAYNDNGLANGSIGSYAITASVLDNDAIYSVATGPGDTVSIVNGVNDGDGYNGTSPVSEGVDKAIDGTTSKYLNFKDFGSGLIVTPLSGSSAVVGLRIFTANDHPDRDPASYRLEGSNDGGLTWTEIGTGGLDLPMGRNPAGQSVSTAEYFQEVLIPNDDSYTSYRLTFPTLRDAATARGMQVGEVQLLTSDVASSTLSTSVSVANVSAQIDTMAFMPASGPDGSSTLVGTFADPGAADTHRLLVNWGDGNIETIQLAIGVRDFAVQHMYAAVGTYQVTASVVDDDFETYDATQPTDTITIIDGVNDGDANGGVSPANESVAKAIDNTTSKHLNFKDLGSGFEVLLGSGATTVVGLRIYTANDQPSRDPASYVLEGSLDGETWAPVSQGALNLPTGRNPAGQPIGQAAHFQELLIPSGTAYNRYRLTFPTIRDAGAANSMQVGEVELLTAASLPTVATTSITLTPNQQPSFTGSNLTIDEDSGLQAVVGWATFDAGSPEESSQTATYHVVVTDGAELFAEAPTIIDDGTLVYRLAADANGTATMEVTVQDNGGTAVGGVDTSLPQLFTITVNPIGDAPRWDSGTTATVGRGAVTTLSSSLLGVSDPDGDSLTFVVESLPTSGELYFADVRLEVGDTFTQADLDSGLILYFNFGAALGGDTLGFGASDGTASTSRVVPLNPTNGSSNVVPPPEGPGWYRLVSLSRLEKSEAGWSADPNGLIPSVQTVWAESWEKALAKLVSGSTAVTGTSGEYYVYDFPTGAETFPSGAYDIGTAAEIASRHANNDLLDTVSGSAAIIALEDRYSDYRNDSDYDDFWAVAFLLFEPADMPIGELTSVNFAQLNLIADPGDGAYSATEWTKSTSDPVAFVRNSKLAFEKVQFKVTEDLDPTTEVRIRASGTDGITIAETLAKRVLAPFEKPDYVLENIESENNLADMVKHYDPAAGGFKLIWEMKIGDGEWERVGVSTNRLYLSLDEPLAGFDRYHSVIHIGSHHGQGATTQADLADKVFAYFGTLEIADWDGDELVYYEDWNVESFTTQSLLEKGWGRCGAMGNLMEHVFNAQGLLASRVGIEPINDAEFFLVNNWHFNGTGVAQAAIVHDPGTELAELLVKYPYLSLLEKVDGSFQWNNDTAYTYRYSDIIDEAGADGQNNENPKSIFGDHCVVDVQVDGERVWYDPSYGVLYGQSTESARLQEFDNTALSGYGVSVEVLLPVREAVIGMDLDGDGRMDGVVDWQVILTRKNDYEATEVGRPTS